MTRKKFETILRNRRSAAASRRSIVELRTEVKRLKDDLKERNEQLRVAMLELTQLRAQVAGGGGRGGGEKGKETDNQAAAAPLKETATKMSAGAASAGSGSASGATARAGKGGASHAATEGNHTQLLLPKQEPRTRPRPQGTTAAVPEQQAMEAGTPAVVSSQTLEPVKQP